jgi:hypothetical protein
MKLISAGREAPGTFFINQMGALSYRLASSLHIYFFKSRDWNNEMEQIIKLKEEIVSLDQRIENQVRLVSSKLEKTDRIEELEDCAAELRRLIDMRKFKSELLVWLTTGVEARHREAVGQR